MATIILTTGVAGTGKSYRRAAVEIFHFLLDGGGNHWSNFPLYPDRIAKECAARTGKPFESYLRRIKLIPKAELDSWELSFDRPQASMVRGPFTYFAPVPWQVWSDGELNKIPHGWAGKDFPETVVKFINDLGQPMAGIDLVGAHIAIDECHNFCKASGTTPKHQRERWGQWLGEIRHIGATVEFLTQSPHKLADEISKEAEIRIDLLNVESERDPFLNIKLADWYELKAGFLTGKYEAKVQMLEKRCVEGRWVKHHSEFFTRQPFYFQFYNSYNKPQAGGVNAPAKIHEYQKRSKKSLLLWFVKKNLYPVFSRFVMVSLVLWICFLGGGKFLFNKLVNQIQHVAKVNGADVQEDKPLVREPAQPVSSVSNPVPAAPSMSSLPAAVRPAPVVREKTLPPKREIIKFSIRLITPRMVLFSDRNWYTIGEYILTGPLKGEQLLEIDFKRRRIRTSKRSFILGDIIEQVRTPIMIETEKLKGDPNEMSSNEILL